MYNSDTELMFPLRVAPQLSDQRGDKWKELVNQVIAPEADVVTKSAFTLLMVRLGGCQGCSADSYRGMRGCTACAKQTIRRFRGTDDELEAQYRQAYQDVKQFLSKI